MQQVIATAGKGFRVKELPDPGEEVMPGVKWGRHEEPLTPAFWAATVWMTGDLTTEEFKLGQTLAEEVTACLLGGHGLPAEVGLAAYDRIRTYFIETGRDVLEQEEIFKLLSAPLNVKGRQVRYRFARQRSAYLAGSLKKLRTIRERDLSDIEFRNALCGLPGIGPKTASWIVRNRRASDSVAILDVHIIRACQIMGVFEQKADPARQYVALEKRFLEFCAYARMRASVLDAVMWDTMRKIRPKLLNFLVDASAVPHKANPPLRRENGTCPAAVAAEVTTGRRQGRPRKAGVVLEAA